MKYIIGGLVLLLCLYIIGYLMKKRYYKEIDRLEAWKIEIMDRPILDEMSKVKQLNMTGQTEELFEKWRNEWDEIVDKQLPDVEEYLFDAEEYIDKYRFKKAKEVQTKIDKHLTDTENSIKKLLAEINELVGSEEKNRTEIEELKEMYREHRKTLLAHRHTFGHAENRLEEQLEEVSQLFLQFEEQTKNGDYLSAREVVLFIQSKLSEIAYKMEAIPNLLVECQSTIPSQVDEVKEGYREMLGQNYSLEHIHFEKEVERIEGELSTYLSLIEKTELAEAEKGIEQIRESIDLLYDLLEKEVLAKHFVSENEMKIKDEIHTAMEANNVLKFEIQHVKQSYHLTEKEQESQNQLEKKITQLFKRFELLEHKVRSEKMAQTILSEELNAIKSQLEAIQEEQKGFSEKLQTLRKDELAAREKVKELSRKIAESIRLVTKSNIPGLSQDYKYLLEDAKSSVQDVQTKLEEKPLDVPSVQKYLEVAVLTVEKVYETTNDLIETVSLAEKVIQYGNRYRSRYSSVEVALKEAELAFRNYQYSEALEQAAASIEAIEPGALKKIESLLVDSEELVKQ
ncbi:septation ring formation regulator EzrA [Bacillus sp. 31A1R]|uniref:Septation ring formation regulator EzrA n=1 Tax=Robertmurraya mangrovi TaxID=3098077 RepID=A0ABU5IZE2_9BACI|nr:septation ring formation regulator EzrA [Bacillus sp. 31A1R]MDZ5472530.1 septation ring formation regulator EzrA [Bacillus sp. 31A1R]